MNGVYIIYLIKVNTSNVCIALIFKNTVERGGERRELKFKFKFKKKKVVC